MADFVPGQHCHAHIRGHTSLPTGMGSWSALGSDLVSSQRDWAVSTTSEETKHSATFIPKREATLRKDDARREHGACQGSDADRFTLQHLCWGLCATPRIVVVLGIGISRLLVAYISVGLCALLFRVVVGYGETVRPTTYLLGFFRSAAGTHETAQRSKRGLRWAAPRIDYVQESGSLCPHRRVQSSPTWHTKS